MVIGNRFFVVVDLISLLAFQCFYYSLALFISWWISSFASAFRFTLMYPHNSHCILCECEILFHIFFSRLSLSKSTQKKYIWVFLFLLHFDQLLQCCDMNIICAEGCRHKLQCMKSSPEILWFIELSFLMIGISSRRISWDIHILSKGSAMQQMSRILCVSKESVFDFRLVECMYEWAKSPNH